MTWGGLIGFVQEWPGDGTFIAYHGGPKDGQHEMSADTPQRLEFFVMTDPSYASGYKRCAYNKRSFQPDDYITHYDYIFS